MKKLLIVAAICCAPAFAITPDGKLSPDEKEVMQRCESEGGCFVVTAAMVQAYARAVVQQYMQAVAEQFDAAVKQEAKNVCKNTI